MASRTPLHPGQRALAFDLDALPQAEGSLPQAEGSLIESEEPTTGQMLLFAPPSPNVTPFVPHSTSAVGDAGENHFQGICGALGVTAFKAPLGNEGFDFHANTSRVEVKTTLKLTKNGRLKFSAGGGRRFSDYAGKTDFFAFVVLGPGVDLYGRILVMPIDAVLRRWSGSCVMLRPLDFPKVPDLSPLVGPSLAATAGAEAKSGGGELVALRVR
jgi:hypothetical protein